MYILMPMMDETVGELKNVFLNIISGVYNISVSYQFNGVARIIKIRFVYMPFILRGELLQDCRQEHRYPI